MPQHAPVVAFFDIDGTLTCPERNDGLTVFPSERVCAAIRAFVAGGNVAVLSTGRAVGLLGELASLPFAGSVTLAGAHVELDGRVVYEHLIAPEVIERTVAEVRRVGMGNAREEVKDVADMVTDTVQDDGVATALERLGLV